MLFDNSPVLFVLLKDVSAVLEKARTETKYKNLLISTVSHELRTPLNTFMSVIDILDEYVEEDGRKYLFILDKSCSLLAHLINDMLVLLSLFSLFLCVAFLF